MNLIKIIFAQVVITILALCLLWQNAQLERSNYVEQRIGTHIEQTTSQLQLLRAEVATLSSPQRITQIVKKLDLPLYEPELTGQQAVATAMPHLHEHPLLDSGEQHIDNAR